MARLSALISLLIVLTAMALSPAWVAQGATDGGTRIKGPKGVDQGAMGRRFGPIKPTDTLWRIAAKIRPDDKVSIYQVMYALYLKNPNAFLDQNFNHIKDNAYLKIPTLREMRRVNAADARRKSELDDELWEAKLRGELNPGKIAKADAQVKNVKKSDLNKAKSELKEDLNKLQSEQTKQYQSIKTDLETNQQELEQARQTNIAQQEAITALEQAISAFAEASKADSDKTQAMLQNLIAEQQRLEEERRRKEAEGFNFAELGQSIAANGVVIALIVTAVVFIAVVFFIIRAIRNKRKADAKVEEDTLFDSPAPAAAAATAAVAAPAAAEAADDMLPEDITNDSFSLDDVDESLTTLDDDLLPEDGAVHLDDALPDDNLYEDDEPGLEGDDLLDGDDSLDGLLDQTDLDDLLGDEDFDLLGGDDDSLEGGGDDLLESADMDDLLNMDGDDGAGETDVGFDDEQDVDDILDSAFEVDAGGDDGDLDSLLDEPAEDANATVTDDDDIEALLAQNQDDGADEQLDEIELDIPEEHEPASEEEQGGNLGADDVDALMEELAQPGVGASEEEIEALLSDPAALETPEPDPADDEEMDIDSLLDANALESEPEDDMDIDNLLDANALESET